MSEKWTIGTILTWTKQYFEGKGVPAARLDAEVLLSHILGKDRLYLYVNFDQPLQTKELAVFREAVKRRAGRIPVAYIIGSKEFMGLKFAVNSAVLIPRPDTEVLVEAAAAKLSADKNAAILDIGTGSGAIIISLLHRLKNSHGVAVDISAEALAVASGNAASLGVAERLELFRGDLFAPVTGRTFDAIVSNPPYIDSKDMDELAPEVRCEPRGALAGGATVLTFIAGWLLRPRNI